MDYRGITLLPNKSTVFLEDLPAVEQGRIYACDFYVAGAEEWAEVPGGYEQPPVVNIDHHAPTDRMTRFVSSANLALERIRHEGEADQEDLVVIHHTDCDSVLTSGLMLGILEPDERFGRAAIAADHTGAEDMIADVLQSLDKYRDLELSFDSLSRVLDGRQLSRQAQESLDQRYSDRERAVWLVESERHLRIGPLSWIDNDQRADGVLIPSLIPDTQLIMITNPLPNGSNEVKLRLGLSAPPRMTLHRLRINEIDPNFGGRWNAGSNQRAGGTLLDLKWYASELVRRLDAWPE